jgi:Ni,Fe-hydrogenase I small subunit
MSFLNAQEPTVVELVTDFGINIIWHPSMGLEIGQQVVDILNDCISGKIHVDIFVFEGTVIQGPKGKGTMNYFCERPMQLWVKELSAIAEYIVAIGDFKTFKYLGFLPKEVATGENKLSHYFKSGVNKVVGMNKENFETSK